MKKMMAVVSLSLLTVMAQAETADLAQNMAMVPPAIVAAAPAAGEEAGNSSWRTLITSVGVVGGVLVADLFMGGSLTASLFGWGSTAAAAGPVVYSPEILSARAAGAVLGEMITPATNLRDIAARRDMFYALMLGVGGTIGAIVSYGLAESDTPTAVK